MPILRNARHERFAQEIAQGKSAEEAYVIAGYLKNSGNASRLKGNERVLKRIEEITSQAAECAVINKAWVLETLRDNALIAMGLKKIKFSTIISGKTVEFEVTDREAAAANRALELIGKELGMFKEKFEPPGIGAGILLSCSVTKYWTGAIVSARAKKLELRRVSRTMRAITLSPLC